MRVYRSLALVLLPLTGAAPLAAQSTLRGAVVDAGGAPMAYATVRLLSVADSALVAGAHTGDDGGFVLEAGDGGDVRLVVTRLGYREHVSEPFALGPGDVRLEPVVLVPEAVGMDEVAVTARRAVFEQRGDRLVVNVGASATLAGGTALDVVARSPGVVVNEQSGTVSMLGKDGVRVLVNGRESYVPADGLVQFLAGMSAESIESVELITAPPAEYDAEGNAGLINIVLTEQPGDGVRGSTSLTGGYGGGELGRASADVQVRRGPLSIVGSYAFLWDGRDQTFTNVRRVTRADGLVESPTFSTREPVQRNHDARVRLDVALGERTTVGGLVAGYDNRWSMAALNTTSVDVGGRTVTRTVSDNEEVNHWRHLMGNVNVRHDLVVGGAVSVDLDVLGYHNDNPTEYRNATTDVASGEVTEEVLGSGKTTPLRIYVAKADYRAPEAGAWSWGAGVKGAASRFTNDPTFVSLVDPAWFDDDAVAEESTLREDVLAAYGSARYAPNDRTTLDVGLRFEQTASTLRTEAGRVLVDRSYGELFPNVALSHGLGEHARLGASYVRRITRPTFNDMAPFIYFLSPSTFFTGSAAVQPATLNALKADATVRDVVASVQYAWEDGSIARFQSRVLSDANVQIFFPTNITATRTLTGLVAAPLALADGWTTQSDATVTRQAVEGVVADRPVERAHTAYAFRTTHNVRAPADLSLEVTGSYQSAALFGAARFEPLWSVNVAVQRALPGGAGELTLAVDDVFDTARWRITEADASVPFAIETVYDGFNRTVRLTYSRRFGTGGGVEARTTASEEESSRVQ